MADKKMLDKKVVDEIKNLSYLEMARLWRYAPTGHIFFDTSLPYFKIFEKRFRKFGGMTTEIAHAMEVKNGKLFRGKGRR